ncbi:MAG TPA: hypothetical protein VK553_07140, partial [Candidatus Nitrosopolaris rasttigaisensis]|nr:hypothetical protein [Candidatus Nitrosopolaris rasttigaisensis]
MSSVYGPGGLINVAPMPINAFGPPPSGYRGFLGQQWFDRSVANPPEYIYNGVQWNSGGAQLATNSLAGSVFLATLAQLQTGTAPSAAFVPSSNDVATVIAAVVAGAGVPATTAVQGYVFLATNAQAAAGLLTDNHAINPGSLAFALANAPAIGGTSAGAGSFTTLAASGLSSLSGSATILTAGTALNLASDADTAAVNIGTGAAARVITVGNVTGATQLVLNAGTAASSINTTNGAFAILTGTGALNLGTDAAAKVITLGNSTGATSISLNTGTGSSLNLGTNAIAHTVTIGN